MIEPVRMVGLWIQELVHVHAQCFSLGLVAKVSALKTEKEKVKCLFLILHQLPHTRLHPPTQVMHVDTHNVVYMVNQVLVLAVCYIPPESSCRGGSSEETLQWLGEKVAEFSSLGSLVICSDFNARCGHLEAEVEGLHSRKIID